jgi:N-acetylglutamate synthase-like GNAT family acetyltransferase
MCESICTTGLTMNNISLRQATGSDWPAVSGLLEANRLPLEGARAHINTFLVAKANHELVGCAGVELYGQFALLRSVAVAPGLHGQRIGTELVTLMLQETRQRNVTDLYLLTTTAQRYFEQFGFSAAGRTSAPPQLSASAEFQGACPTSAQLMVLGLGDRQAPTLERLPVVLSR